MTETLEEIESVFDRMATWVTTHPGEFLGGVAGVLVVTAAVGGFQWYGSRVRLDAAQEIGRATAGYYEAMGAQPGTTSFVEPANPETARTVREKYAARLAELAEDHAGTASSVDAWLLAGNLRGELGDDEAALGSFERAVDDAASGSELQGLALVRLAEALDAAGRFEDAARAWERASEIRGFPLRRQALAYAARSWADAGDEERARALADRVEAEPAEGFGAQLPAHVEARLAELRRGR